MLQNCSYLIPQSYLRTCQNYLHSKNKSKHPILISLSETTNPETFVFTGNNQQNIRIEFDEPTQQMFQNFFNQFDNSSTTSQSHSTGNTRTFQTSTSYSTADRPTTPQPTASQPSAARQSSPRPTAPPKNQTVDSDDLPSYNDVMGGLYGHKK